MKRFAKVALPIVAMPFVVLVAASEGCSKRGFEAVGGGGSIAAGTVDVTDAASSTTSGADCLTSTAECTGVTDCSERCCSTSYNTHSMMGVLHYFCS